MLPDTVNGLPLHPLTVHAAVVLIPLASLLGIVYAVPPLRNWARWPLALVAVAAAGATFVSVQAGEAFEEALGLEGPAQELIERHEELGKQLLLMVAGYAVVAVAAALLAGRGALTVVLSVVLVVGAVAIGVQSYRVGELGSQAVWNPGDADYSAD